jgi:serine protease Do
MYGFAKGGVIIGQIVPGGGAAKAGLQPGDVLVTIDGRAIKDGDDLVADISARRIGSTIKLGYLRGEKQNTATVAIGDRAKTYADIAGNPGDDDNAATPEIDAGQNKLGITVSAVPAAMASKLGLKSGGVIVTSVRSGSFADEINLLKGAVIMEINRKPVTDEASYRSIVSGLKSGDDAVFVVRDIRGNSYVGGTLP